MIVDSRSHGGGGEGCPSVWMNRFLGNREASWKKKFLHVLECSNVKYDVQSRLHEYAFQQVFPEDAVISQNQTEYLRTRDSCGYRPSKVHSESHEDAHVNRCCLQGTQPARSSVFQWRNKE